MRTVPTTAELISAARTIAAALRADGWHDDNHHPVLEAVSLELEGTYDGDINPEWLDEMLDIIESEGNDPRDPSPRGGHLRVVPPLGLTLPDGLSQTVSSLPPRTAMIVRPNHTDRRAG
jgi:hypothetical protein